MARRWRAQSQPSVFSSHSQPSVFSSFCLDFPLRSRMSFARRLRKEATQPVVGASSSWPMICSNNLKSWAPSGIASASNAIPSFIKKFPSSSESNRARVPLVLLWRVRRIRWRSASTIDTDKVAFSTPRRAASVVSSFFLFNHPTLTIVASSIRFSSTAFWTETTSS